MFKRFRKSIQEAGRGNAPQNVNPSQQPATPHDEASGFICPICMAGFSSPDQLQVHFDQVHAETLDATPQPRGLSPSLPDDTHEVVSLTNGKESQVAENGLEGELNRAKATEDSEPLHFSADFQSPSKKFTGADSGDAESKVVVNADLGTKIDENKLSEMEYSELETTLKEEKWYSSELKSELDKKVSELQDQQAELDLVKQQMGIAIATNEELAREKEKVIEKLTSRSQECAELQSQVDELKTEKSAHLESAKNQSAELEKAATWIRNLEAQLIERPGADDVLVLKKELVSVQQLMDQLTLDSEQKLEEAKMKCKGLEEEKDALIKEMEDMKKSHETDIQSQKNSEAILVESLQQRESQSSKLEEEGRKEKDRMKEELANVQSSLENEQSHSHELQIKNNELEEKFINERDEKQKYLDELNVVKSEVAKIKKENEVHALELSSKEKELIKSKSKIDEIMLAMDSSSSKADVELQEMASKIDSLTQKYDDSERERSSFKKELEESIKSKNVIQDELNKVREAHRQLELDKNLEIQKFEQIVETLNAKLSQASSSDSELHEKIKTLENDAKNSWDEVQEERSKSRLLALEHENQIRSLESEKKRLEDEVQSKENRFQEELKKRQSIEEVAANKDLEINSLVDEKASLVRCTEDLEKNLQEAKTRTNSIIKKKDDILADVKRLQQERSDLMEKMEVGEGQAILVGQLRDENESLIKRLEERDAKAKDVTAEHTAKVKELEATISENIAAISQYENSVKSSEALIKKLENTMENVKEEKLNLEKELEQKNDEMKKMQDMLSNQKIEFENKNTSHQRSLEEKTREYDKLSSEFDGFKTSSEASLKMMEISRSGLQESLNTLREEKTRVEAEKKGLEDKLSIKDNEVSNLTASIDSLKKQQLDDLETLKATHTEKKAELDAQLLDSRDQCNKLKQEVETANAKITETEERLADGLKQVQLLEIELKDRERVTLDLKKDYENADSRSNQLKNDIQKIKNDHLSEVDRIKKEHSKSIESMQAANEKICADLRNDLDDHARQHKSEIADLKDQLEQSNEAEKSSSQEITKLEVLLKEKSEEIQSLRECSANDKADFERRLQESSVEISELQEMNQRLSDEKRGAQTDLDEKQLAITSLEVKFSTLQDDFETKDRELKNTNERLEANLLSLKSTEANMGATASKLAEVEKVLLESKENNKTLETRLQDLKSQLDTSVSEKVILKGKLDEVTSKLEGAESTIQEKDEELKTMEQYFSSKEKELISASELLTSEVAKLKTEISAEKGKLEEEVFLRNQDKETWKNEKDEILNELEAKKSQWKDEKDELMQSQEMLKGAQQILISSKMDLQKQHDEAQRDAENWKTQFDDAQDSFKNFTAESEERENKLANELKEEKQKLEAARDEKQNVEARLQLEVSTLRENLDSVRGEWQQALQQVEEKNTESDELRGQVVVLQATVQNNADERRALLERCIAAEQSVEQYKQNESQLKKRLDNAQAAMHELGRENQAMQVKHSTVLSRQWADDREAIECSACRKAFSITVRRHHCRHCGKIFCAECSAKTATVASSKKPVRVCEKCYDDLLVVQ